MQANKSRLLLGSTVIMGIYLSLRILIAYAYAATIGTPAPIVISLEAQNVISGAISGAAYGGLGYWHDALTMIDPKTGKPEAFNGRQFASTVAIGTVVGLFIPITTPTDIAGFAVVTGTAFTNFGTIWFIQRGATIAHALSGKQIVLQPSTP